VLSINNLTKTYPGGTRALRGVSLQIPQGMFGLLGPNGAGKSTLMKILATLLEPDEGTAQLDGLNLVEQKLARSSDICRRNSACIRRCLPSICSSTLP
jgi:ABC-2 type transport system ATP-binding protein